MVVAEKTAALVAGRARGARARPGDGRGRRGRRERLHEVRPRGRARRPARSGRVRRGRRDRREHVHLDRAQPAAGRPRHRDPGHRPACRAGGRRRRARMAGRPRRGARHRRTRGPGRGGGGHRQPDARLPGVRPRGRDGGGVEPDPAGRVRRVPGAHGCVRGVGFVAGNEALAAVREEVAAHRRAARRRACASWSASPAWTGTPTAPSRSPCVPATPGFEVVYQGIRLTSAQIVAAAVAEDVARRGPVDPVRLAHGGGPRGAGRDARGRA